ncbi:MAG: 16S rRNA processing protein RimM [Actinobacteria bacterium]|nr:16S rRNA processing protein RimM [Actinomycetota bacterium]
MNDEATPLLEIGRIDRSHGLRGEVLVSLITNVEGRLVPGLELITDDGMLVVVRAQPHQHRWIVQFDGVSSREVADALRGTVLRARAADDPADPDALWAHQVVGAEVVDVEGTSHGVVVSLIGNPASDLLELESGALVPLTFITGWDGERRLVVDPPAGLLDEA